MLNVGSVYVPVGSTPSCFQWPDDSFTGASDVSGQATATAAPDLQRGHRLHGAEQRRQAVHALRRVLTEVEACARPPG
jgi:hypothetical protein